MIAVGMFCFMADEALNQFLASVEKRAYSMALVAVNNSADALDIVQESMLTLARKYADKPPAEWTPLFYRILKNRITDHHRAATVRRKLFGWFSRDDDTDADAGIALAPAPEADEPARRYELNGTVDELHDALHALPPRQQQAFMLRCWEGLDVRSTARVMGCSGGSVKTHYSRAIHALRAQLEDSGDV